METAVITPFCVALFRVRGGVGVNDGDEAIEGDPVVDGDEGGGCGSFAIGDEGRDIADDVVTEGLEGDGGY